MKTALILLMFGLSSAMAAFDHSHSQWDAILKDYTVKEGAQVYVQYKALKKNQAPLQSYLKQLESVSQKEFAGFGKNEKLAFWINAYNAYTLAIVLKNYPLKSIKDIKSGWFSSGPWKKQFIQLLGKTMSLDNIEHDSIRKNFKEPRIHFAVNCASMSCPSLLPEAFVGEKMDQQLSTAANNFLNNKNKNEVKGNTLELSMIFKWYGDDFKQGYKGYQDYIIQTLKLPKKDYQVKFKEYDWSLNEK